MEEFWIQLLVILTLVTQTSSPSDPTELIGAVGGSVTFRSPSTDTKPALWSFGSDPIVTVLFEDPPRPVFHQKKFQTRVTVSEDGRALSISQLSTEDAGTYSVNVDGKKSTFTLLMYRKLPEPTVTCETQNCSCAPLGSWVRIGLIVGAAVMVFLFIFLLLYCKPPGWRRFHLSQSKPTDTVTTAESMTVSDEVEPSEKHIPNGIKGEPEGEESSNTVYSLVKRPEQAENVTVTGLGLV